MISAVVWHWWLGAGLLIAGLGAVISVVVGYISQVTAQKYPNRRQRQAQKYFELMPPGVFSIGRAGSYLYGIDIDDCIRQAMLLAEIIKQGGQDHPVPGKNYHFPELK